MSEFKVGDRVAFSASVGRTHQGISITATVCGTSDGPFVLVQMDQDYEHHPVLIATGELERIEEAAHD